MFGLGLCIKRSSVSFCNLRCWHYSRRGIIYRRPESFFPKPKDTNTLAKIEKIKEKKWFPKDFEIIYFSEAKLHTAIAGVFFFAYLVAIPACIYFYLNWPEEWNDVVAVRFMIRKHDLPLTLCVLIVLCRVKYIMLTRQVNVIFRKDDEYKTVIRGLFGKIKTQNHQAHEYVPLYGIPTVYKLKNRILLLRKENFFKEADYYKVREY